MYATKFISLLITSYLVSYLLNRSPIILLFFCFISIKLDGFFSFNPSRNFSLQSENVVRYYYILLIIYFANFFFFCFVSFT